MAGLRNFTSNTAAAASSIAGTCPVGVPPGEYILCVLDYETTLGGTLTLPPGFSILTDGSTQATVTYAAGTKTLAVYIRTATSADNGNLNPVPTYTFSWSSGSGAVGIAVIGTLNCQLPSVIATGSGTSGDGVAPAVTPSLAESLVLAIDAVNNSGDTITAPPSLVQFVANSGKVSVANGVCFTWGTLNQQTATSTGSFTFAHTVGTTPYKWGTITIAFPPVNIGGGIQGSLVRRTTAIVGRVFQNVCADAAGVNAYIADSSSGRTVYKMTIATGAMSSIAHGIAAGTIRATALSLDETILYILMDTGDVWASPLASPTATRVAVAPIPAQTTNWFDLLADPQDSNRLFVANFSLRGIYEIILGSGGGSGQHYNLTGSNHFNFGIGRGATLDELVVTLGANAKAPFTGSHPMFTVFKRSKKWPWIAACSGRATGLTYDLNSSAYTASAVGVATTSLPMKAAADAESNVYVPRNCYLSKSDGGILYDLCTSLGFAGIQPNTTGAAGSIGALWYCPTAKVLLAVTAGTQVYVMR